MKTQQTDVMIHTRIALDDAQFSEVVRQVNKIGGVARFERNRIVPRLIMVAYDSSQTKALTILHRITRLGFPASLVGI